jgi:NADH dehydrogenase FAD-containing subunit
MQKRLVIIGGGVAGHRAAHRLQGAANVTLIDPKTYFEIPMAMPRHVVRPAELPSLLPYAEFLPDVRHLQGAAMEVGRDRVTLDDGRSAAFEVLLIASGANYRSELVKPASGEPETRLDFYRDLSGRVAVAERIVIIGGGPIGVEIAGEILEQHPGKQLALVEGAERLLPALPPTISRWAADFLSARGAQVLVGDSVESPRPPPGDVSQNGVVVTRSGRQLPFDLALWCLGARPAAEFMRRHLPDVLNGAGEVRVDDHLRAVGAGNIFAVGDVTDIPHKGAVALHPQLPPVIANIRRVLEAGPGAALVRFKGVRHPTTALISLGRNHGLLNLPIGRFRAGWLARKLKTRHMLVDHLRHELKLPYPVPAKPA